MGQKLRLVVVAVSLCVVCPVTPAFGRRPIASQKLNSAKQQFDKGMASLNDGRFSAAVEYFERSLALAPRASTAFNLAVALRGKGDAVGAVKRLKQLLAGRYGEVSAEQRERVESLLKKANREVASIALRVRGPKNTTVRLDGVVLPAKRVQRLRVNPGVHRLTASAPDHGAPDRAVRLRPGERRSVVLVLNRTVDRRNGTLRILSDDRRAWISVEGVRLRRKAPWVKSLKPGAYTVRVVGSDASTRSQVTVVAGRTVTVRLNPARSSSIFSSGWFWAGVGAVAIAGGTTAAILLTPRERRAGLRSGLGHRVGVDVLSRRALTFGGDGQRLSPNLERGAPGAC